MSSPAKDKPPYMPSFRAPRSTSWQVLKVPPDAEPDEAKKAERSREELSQTLLASLKMEHVVVLAGSGC